MWVTTDKISWRPALYRYLNHCINHIDTAHAEALLTYLMWWFLFHVGENGYTRVMLYSSSTLHRCQSWCRVIYYPTHLLKLFQKTVTVCAGHTLFFLWASEMKSVFLKSTFHRKKRHLGFKRFQSSVNLDFPFCSFFHQGKDILKHPLCILHQMQY